MFWFILFDQSTLFVLTNKHSKLLLISTSLLLYLLLLILKAHFEHDQYEKVRADGKRKLKCSAIPTVFAHRPAKLKRKLPRYKQASEAFETPPQKVQHLDHTYSHSTAMAPQCLEQQENVEGLDDPTTSNVLSKALVFCFFIVLVAFLCCHYHWLAILPCIVMLLEKIALG